MRRLLSRSFHSLNAAAALLVLAVTHSALAQTDGFDPNVNHYNGSSYQLVNDTANGFTVEYHKWYKLLHNHIKGETYALVCCGQPTTNFTGYNLVVNTPVTNVGVANAPSVLPFMELLGLSDTVKSIQGYQNVTSTCYGNVTDSPGNNTVDIVFNDQSNVNLAGSNYVGFSPDSIQLTPLQQASWLVYVAHFFDKESEATTAYANIANTYNCHKSNLASLTDKKNVAFTSYDAAAKTWTLLRDPFYASLAQDAGSTLVEPNKAQDSSYMQLNEFHTAISYADYVVDMTSLDNLGNQTYDSWLNLGGFIDGMDVFDEPFVTNKNVFRFDGLVNGNGYSDFPERSPARPDLALRDIISMIEPTYDANYTYTWLRNFAKSDVPRQISQVSYQCDAQSIFQQTQCTSNPFGKTESTPNTNEGSNSSSHGLSSGGKAGVSVGVIVGVLGAGILAFFLYRRYQMNKNVPKRPFYRMNDIH